MPKFKIGDEVRYIRNNGKHTFPEIRGKIEHIDHICYYFNTGGNIEIYKADEAGGDWELELVKNYQAEDKTMYKFNTSSEAAIDFDMIYKEVSRQKPLMKVEFRAKDKTAYYLVIHDSLWAKAGVLGIKCPVPLNQFSPWMGLEDPAEYSLWKQWTKKVVNAPWIGEKGEVTVEELTL